MDQIDGGAPEVTATETALPSSAPGARPSSELIERSCARPSTAIELFESLLVTILLALFATTFVVQAYKIPSESMEPTLLVGDHVLVNKFVFEGSGAWYEKLLPYRAVRHDDIVIFKYPYEDNPDYVKRVIGLPGDRIRIVGGHVYLNGSELNEPYVVHERPRMDPAEDNFPPLDPYTIQTTLLPQWAKEISNYIDGGDLVVPPNRYFVMGDNRDDSLDSRYWGFVDRDAVMGKPILIYWSVDATSDDYADRSIFGAFEGIAETLIHLPSRTRWHRLLREVH